MILTLPKLRTLVTALCLAAGLAMPARAELSAAERAQAASTALTAAIEALDAASGAKDRVAALTGTIKAYEEGLGALREGLRQVTIRESAIRGRFEAKSERVARLLGILATMEREPDSLLLIHPSGPLGSVRSGMILSDVTPALHAEAEALRAELEEVALLRALQEGAAETLSTGLVSAQRARTTLSQAMSDRKDLPVRLTENNAELAAIVESIDTLDALSEILADRQLQPEEGALSFADARGTLPLPVLGSLLRSAGEADAAGVRRPGILVATRSRALVTTPFAATIRYRGPLLDYGNVIILEPGDGYLMVLAGLDQVYGEPGQVIEAGTPVGLMGGEEPGAEEFLVAAQEGGGAERKETLYIEIREGSEPEDPAVWFEVTRE